MGRKRVVLRRRFRGRAGGGPAPNDQNLHDRLRMSPGLLPIEDLDLDGPMLMVLIDLITETIASIDNSGKLPYTTARLED
jgi:hypothetical protein